MKTILLIDDEIEIADLYAEALKETGYDVIFFCKIDDFFDDNRVIHSKIDIIILDIMMLPGHRYASKNSNGGLTTGKLLYSDLKLQFPNAHILVLTNVSDIQASELFDNEPNIMILEKIHYSPDELVSYLSTLYSESETALV